MLQGVDGHVLRAVVLEHAPDVGGAADDQQVAHEDGDPDGRLDEVLDERVTAVDHGIGRALRREERQHHEQPQREHDGHDECQRHCASTHRDTFAGSGEGPGAHQPPGADDQRLVEHHDPAEERRAREAVPVEDAVERLLGTEYLSVRSTHCDADGIAAAHEDAFHERLAAVCETRHGQAVPPDW